MDFNYLKIKTPAFFGLIYSGSLLLAALAFEYIGKFIPCQMCLWQRWAHIAVIFLCLLIIVSKNYSKKAIILIAMFAFISSILGFWHS